MLINDLVIEDIELPKNFMVGVDLQTNYAIYPQVHESKSSIMDLRVQISIP